jgi:hypothetical protein
LETAWCKCFFSISIVFFFGSMQHVFWQTSVHDPDLIDLWEYVRIKLDFEKLYEDGLILTKSMIIITSNAVFDRHFWDILEALPLILLGCLPSRFLLIFYIRVQ